MNARVRESPDLELVAACGCGAASPLRRVLYLPLPTCTDSTERHIAKALEGLLALQAQHRAAGRYADAAPTEERG
jgi:hypothetical protein